jgi:uncharacterized membrane protein YdjX (TVP38/TMEM64 family)
MTRLRLLALLLLLAVALAGAAQISGHDAFAQLQARLGALLLWRAAHPWLAVLGFALGYIAAAALSLPINVVLALAGGAVFGAEAGTVVVCAAAATGSTLAMLCSRWLLRDIVRRRFARRLDEVERGLAQDGWLYLLSLRLMPVVPYTVVNLLFGLTRFPAWRFLLVSLLGMAPATLLYVRMGTGLTRLTGPGDVLSLRMVWPLAVLAVLPLVFGRMFRRMRQKSKITTKPL